MPLQYFPESTPNTNPDVPTITDWIKDNKDRDGQAYMVRSVRVTDKVICVYTDAFLGFIWKSEKLANYLMEAIIVYCQEAETPYLMAVIDSKNKRKFQLAIETDGKSRWTNEDAKLWYQIDLLDPNSEHPPSPVTGENPLLPKPGKGDGRKTARNS